MVSCSVFSGGSISVQCGGGNEAIHTQNMTLQMFGSNYCLVIFLLFAQTSEKTSRPFYNIRGGFCARVPELTSWPCPSVSVSFFHTILDISRGSVFSFDLCCYFLLFHHLLCEIRVERSFSSINLEDSNLSFLGYLNSKTV